MPQRYYYYNSIAFRYNKILIDQAVDNFYTINVAGRGLLAPEVETISVPARNGDIVTSQKYPPRNIKVTYLIKGTSSSSLRRSLDQLNVILKTKNDVPFEFSDEAGYRTGRLFEMEEPPENAWQGTGTITIHCQDPFRRMPVQTQKGLDFSILPQEALALEFLQLDLLVSDPKKVQIKNLTSGKTMVFHDFPTGGKLQVTPKTITLNGGSAIKYLDHSVSTWKDFTLNSRDRLIITGAKEPATLLYRRLL